MLHRWFFMFVFGVLLSQSLHAQSRQEGVGSHIEAMMRVRQAAAARTRGDLEEAARLLREATDLWGPPSSLRELAVTLEDLHRWREAAGAWTRYAALAHTPAERDAAVVRREALAHMLTPLRVRVEPVVAARIARVWFDRDPPQWYAAGGLERVIEGGRHRIRVEAAGYQPWEMMVPTGYGEAVNVVAVMVRVRAPLDGGVR
jgi:hypothetical protein